MPLCTDVLTRLWTEEELIGVEEQHRMQIGVFQSCIVVGLRLVGILISGICQLQPSTPAFRHRTPMEDDRYIKTAAYLLARVAPVGFRFVERLQVCSLLL